MKKYMVILISLLILQSSFGQDAKIFLKQVELEKIYSSKLIRFLNKLYDESDYYVYTDVRLETREQIASKEEKNADSKTSNPANDPFSYSFIEGLGLDGSLPTIPGGKPEGSRAKETNPDEDYVMTNLRISVYLSENIYDVESREAITNFVNTNIEEIRNCFDCFLLEKMPSKGNEKAHEGDQFLQLKEAYNQQTLAIESTLSQYEELKDSIKWSIFQQEQVALREEIKRMQELDATEKELLKRQLDEANSAREFWEDQEARRKELDNNLDSLRYINLMDIEKEYREKQSELLESVTTDYEMSIQSRLDNAEATEERLFALIENKGDGSNGDLDGESWSSSGGLPMFAIIIIVIVVSVVVGLVLLKLNKKKVVYLKPKNTPPPPPPAFSTPPTASAENSDVLRSEVRSLRQSAVTMSAGQKEGASQIISDWLDESSSEDGEDNETDKEE